MTDTRIEPLRLRADEDAALLALSRTTVVEPRASRKVASVQVGRYRRRVPTAALDVFLAAPHEASAPFPRIQIPTLHQWSESVVELRHDLRLFDLRDPQPGRLGIERDQPVSTRPVNDRWARR